MGMTRLSVNVNKVALLRNARGGDVPNLMQVVQDAVQFGAQGITVHPRPDERHIRYQDVHAIANAGLPVELNVEGYPSEAFLALMEATRPAQVTLVPDPPDALTSSEGWDTQGQQRQLRQVIQRLQASGIRTSLFLEPKRILIEAAAQTGTDRIEFYTGPYARQYHEDPGAAVQPYVEGAEFAYLHNLGLNAGHDLDLENLRFFKQRVPQLLEVSIGHALISDALYLGLERAIQLYLACLED
jgi:pyridoxine 5-phosphate synthase